MSDFYIYIWEVSKNLHPNNSKFEKIAIDSGLAIEKQGDLILTDEGKNIADLQQDEIDDQEYLDFYNNYSEMPFIH